MKANVHVVDDDPQMCASIGFVLESAGHDVQVYSGAREFLHRMPHARPGCVLLDVRMREMDGLNLLEEIRQTPNPMPVIMMSGHADMNAPIFALTHGAVDFLLKPFAREVLIPTVNRAIELDHRRIRNGIESNAARERLASLTDRQREILRLVIQGKPSKEVGRILGLSTKTVENHRTAILQKTNAESISSLVQDCLLSGLWAPHEDYSI